ncbi:Uncharacterised protein [Raoultella planticola]|uniref:Uncharacterized protein n=1 Tax=Raoultella planticola TaxID=575 RepID=A0A485D906_RAOPL|nr:Uncharacterised protein [Raoultella planticola]
MRIGITAAGALIRHAAAIQVVETDHAVDIRVFRQQVSFNNFHHIIDDARDASARW